MAKLANEKVRFWHVADLHLYGECADHGESACANCIKTALLDRMLATIRGGSGPNLLLLAGDLLEKDEPWIAGARRLQNFVEAVQASGVVVAGVTGEHDPALEDWRHAVKAKWLLGTGEVNDEAGIVVRGVSGSPKQAKTKAWVHRVCREPLSEASILLAHSSDVNLPKTAVDEAGFSYCALGHRHTYRVTKTAGGAVVAYPGHVCSYWDGSGKAWPTFFIDGTIERTGVVMVEAVNWQAPPYSAPATRQLYIPRQYRNRPSGVLVFVNPPAPKVLTQAGVLPDRGSLKNLLDFGDSGLGLQRVTFTYRSAEELRTVVGRILGATPRDVFVAPSHLDGSANRTVDFGARLLEDLDWFIKRSYLKNKNTDTSDGEAAGDRIREPLVGRWQAVRP